MGVIGVTVAEPDIDKAGDSIPVPILPSYVEVIAVVVLDEDFIVAFIWVEVESEELALIVLLLLLPMLLLSGG